MVQDQARGWFYRQWKAKHGTLHGAQAAFQVKLDEIARERDPDRAYRMVQALKPPAPPRKAAKEATLLDSLYRGAKGVGLALDLGAYGMEQGARKVFGDEAVNNINTWSGHSPNASADILAASVREYNAMPQNKTLARASKRFDEAGGFLPGVGAWAQTIGEDPMSIAHLAAEQVPGLVLGAGAGKVVSAAAVPVATRVAPMAAVPVARGMVFGSTMAGTQTALGAGSNVAAANAAEGGGRLTPGQIGMGVRQTAGEMPAAMLTGGAMGWLPFKGVSVPEKFGAAASNAAVQSGIQALGGVGSRIGGDLATGRRSTGGELFTAGAAQMPFVQLDMALRAGLVGGEARPGRSAFVDQAQAHLDAGKNLQRYVQPGPPRKSDRVANARRVLGQLGAQVSERAGILARNTAEAFAQDAPWRWQMMERTPYVNQDWMVGEGAPRPIAQARFGGQQEGGVADALTFLPNLAPDHPVFLQFRPRRVVQDTAGRFWFQKANGMRLTPSGLYQFVTMPDGSIRAARKNLDRRFSTHLGLSGGNDVSYAGSVRFANRNTATRGSVRSWSNNSGHYLPPAESAGNAGLPIDLFEPLLPEQLDE